MEGKVGSMLLKGFKGRVERRTNRIVSFQARMRGGALSQKGDHLADNLIKIIERGLGGIGGGVGHLLDPKNDQFSMETHTCHPFFHGISLAF